MKWHLFGLFTASPFFNARERKSERSQRKRDARGGGGGKESKASQTKPVARQVSRFALASSSLAILSTRATSE